MPDAGRVVAGSARGVRLLAPGEVTRPLADRVKQTLFAILEAGSLGEWPAPFLDLYAGSGAAGIEALSRGAGRATFVERDARAVRVIEQNLARAGVAGGRVVRSDVLRFLERDATAEGGPFGAVVVDPPYGDAAILAALERLAAPEREWLAPGAVVVAKHFWRDALPDRIGHLRHVRDRRFGETNLAFYSVEDA
jgi:16S rRNA (guanine966-N2)-methyltransferase